MTSAKKRELCCPSAPAEAGVALVFGVVGGEANAPELQYLSEPVPLTPELSSLADGIQPEEVYRMTSRCQEQRCQHFTGSSCRLGQRLRDELPAVTSELPACSIRATCRWFQEQGTAICFRCPAVVTQVPAVAPQPPTAKARRRLRVLQP